MLPPSKDLQGQSLGWLDYSQSYQHPGAMERLNLS